MQATLKNRKEFLALRTSPRHACAAFVIQGDIGPCETKPCTASGSDVAVGYTVTKKTGNSVERNRIKRRLRHAFAEAVERRSSSLECRMARLVLVARRQALAEPYERMVAEMTKGIDRLAAKGNKAPG